MAVFLEIQLLRYKPQYTWPGLIIVLLGVPVYFLWKMADKSNGSSDAAAAGGSIDNERGAQLPEEWSERAIRYCAKNRWIGC